MGLRVLKTRLAGAAAVTVSCVVAVAASGATTTVQASHDNGLGALIVVNAIGRTLYVDGKGIKCNGPCVNQWLPLTVAKGVKPVAGKGLKASMVGTVKRPNGAEQVTYDGYALYAFAGDSKDGELNGQGVGGVWHVLGANGVVITKSLSTSAGAVSSSGSSGSSGSSSSSSGSSGSSSGSTGSTGSSGSSSGSTGSGSTGSGSTGTGGGTSTSDCATNPGGYGCM